MYPPLAPLRIEILTIYEWYTFTMSLFKERVLAIVKHIPKGSVLTYGEVAEKAGNPGASRAVGTIMSHNKDTTIPCHRVVRSDGKIGGYNFLRGVSKISLLKKEGVIFSKNDKITFTRI